MPATYPADLPHFLFEGYGDAPRSPVDERDWGLGVRRRQIFSDLLEQLSVSLSLTWEQWQTFQTFYEVTLLQGTLTFNATILIEGVNATHEVRFVGSPPDYTPAGPNRVRASAHLLTVAA